MSTIFALHNVASRTSIISVSDTTNICIRYVSKTCLPKLVLAIIHFIHSIRTESIVKLWDSYIAELNKWVDLFSHHDHHNLREQGLSDTNVLRKAIIF